MTGISTKVSGFSSVQKKLDTLSKESLRIAQEVLVDATFEIVEQAKKSIQQVSHSGRFKKAGKSGKTHEFSKEGDAPNIDTGDLHQSVSSNIDLPNITSEVGTNLRKGAWLEFGTKYMGARPWLGPAYRKHASKFLRRIRRKMKSSIKRVKQTKGSKKSG